MTQEPADKTSRRPKPKKAAALSMRITQSTRDALEAEADRDGRPVSEVAERWLDEASIGRATVEAMLGGSAAPALRAMIAFADEVQKRLGDPTEDGPARYALVEGWSRLAALSLPSKGLSDERMEMLQAQTALEQTCRRLIAAAREWLGTRVADGERTKEIERFRSNLDLWLDDIERGDVFTVAQGLKVHIRILTSATVPETIDRLASEAERQQAAYAALRDEFTAKQTSAAILGRRMAEEMLGIRANRRR